MHFNKYIVVVLFTAFSASALNADNLKQDVKKIGQDFKQLGRDIKDKAKEVGQEAKKVGENIANETRQAQQTAKDSSKDWGQRFKAAFTEIGAGLKNAWGHLAGSPTTTEKNKDDFD